MFASRPPRPALRSWVRLLWAGDPGAGTAAAHREHVLPSGTMHLALRLDGPPLRIYPHADDAQVLAFGHAVVGGVRSSFYAREAGVPGCSVGAQLEPGAARFLFGAPAGALAESHVPLDALWGRAAALLREQLQETTDAQGRMAILEAHLLARLASAHGPHPAVATALLQMRRGASVTEAVRAGGLSHRHLLLHFRAWTGLAPAEHARVLRFQQALQGLARPHLGLAEVSAFAGYADQAHLTRDFRAFAGLTPGDWRRAAPRHTHHVSTGRVKSVQDRAAAPR